MENLRLRGRSRRGSSARSQLANLQFEAFMLEKSDFVEYRTLVLH